MQIDALIVGQGLAGSLLAWQLIQQDYRVMVIDDGVKNASQVAAGLINPLGGARLLKSPELEVCLPTAKRQYQLLQQQFHEVFLVELPMLRILKTVQQQQHARQRLSQPDYHAYLKGWLDEVPGLNTPFGALQQQQTAYLRTSALLAALKAFLISQQSYRLSRFDYSQLQLQPQLQWQDLKPRLVIFCEGHHARFNPWFGDLPFQVAKGDILTGRLELAKPLRQIINYGHWLLPLLEGDFKTGASFDAESLDLAPSELARQQLLASMKAVWPQLGQFEVTAHETGIRPATLDKLPLIGAHQQYPQLHIFNGFGSKGSLLIPWYAEQFCRYLQQHPLPPHCNISRCYDSDIHH